MLANNPNMQQRVRISDPVVQKAMAIASTAPPDVPLCDPDAERALALRDQNPSDGVERRARRRYEQAVFRLRRRVLSCFGELDRVGRQLDLEHDRRAELVAEGPSDNCENLGREQLFLDQWLKLILAGLALLALGVVSVAVTQIMLRDSGLASSPWQGAAIGMIPFIGALLLAFAVAECRLVATRDAMRKLVHASALVALALWIPLTAVLVGKQAMEDPADVIAAGVIAALSGVPAAEPILGLDFPLLYSIVMLLLDVLAAASFKLIGDKVLIETRRVGSSRSGYFDSQAEELRAISDERAGVAEAKAALEGLQGELERGAQVYADAVLAAVFHHQRSPSAQTPAPQPILMSSFINGSTFGG